LRLLSILGMITFVSISSISVLRIPGTFLALEDPIEPAAAIIVLGGGFPAREREAADLYRAGLAPKVVVTREAQNREAWWRAEGRRTTTDLQREALMRGGVPASAIIVPEGEAVATYDELKLIVRTFPEGDSPVILVTSAYHARRVRLSWNHVAGDPPRAIVRATRHDPFDAERWWQDRRWVRAILREYVGLLDAWIGFPVASRLAIRPSCVQPC